MNVKNPYGFVSEEEEKRVLVQLKMAAWAGLVSSPDLDAVEERRKQKNEEISKKLAEGEAVYGLTYYTPAMYLQYELTRFKLDYTVYPEIFLDGYSKNASCSGSRRTDGFRQERDTQKAFCMECALDCKTPPEKYLYQEITEAQKQAFYEENRDLFTRYSGDSFEYREVGMIIEKRLREQEYENIIQDLLR